MVDPVGPSGSVPNISQVSRVTQKQKEASGDVDSLKDSVSISEEAISLAEAQRASEEVAQRITERNDLSLSNDLERLNQLI